MSVHKESKRITTHTLQEMKSKKEKIAMLTAYDYSTALILDEAGIDVLLVGDSASNVMAGHETTLPITLDQMIYHASSVVRAVKRALVVVDLPFGSYQGNSKEALQSSIRIMKESGAHAVKLEGGAEVKESIERIISRNIGRKVSTSRASGSAFDSSISGSLRPNPGSLYSDNSFFDFVQAQITSSNTKILASPTLILQEGNEPYGPDSDGTRLSADGKIGRSRTNEAFVRVGTQFVTAYDVKQDINGNNFANLSSAMPA